MNIKDIVIKYLEENGYDGLFCPSDGCACLISDLQLCGYFQNDCGPGYKKICKPKDCEGCIADCCGHPDGVKWTIAAKKEAPKA